MGDSNMEKLLNVKRNIKEAVLGCLLASLYYLIFESQTMQSAE